MSAICSTGVPLFHQPGRQRMPQRVHAVAAFLAHRNVRHPGVLDQDLMQMILVGERADRGGVPHEHLRAVAVRPAMADVVDHRPADIFQQRQLHPVTGLGLHHGQPVARPVEVGELQPFDVHAAQPEPGDQQDDRVIAFPARVAPVDRLQDPGHVGRDPTPTGSWPAWPSVAAGTASSTRAVDQAVGAGEPQERPHRAQFLLDRLDLVSGQRGNERLDHAGVAAGQPAAGAGERDELPGHRPVGPHGRGGAPSRPQPRLEPGDRRRRSAASSLLTDRE